jgi:hypothetical protein
MLGPCWHRVCRRLVIGGYDLWTWSSQQETQAGWGEHVLQTKLVSATTGEEKVAQAVASVDGTTKSPKRIRLVFPKLRQLKIVYGGFVWFVWLFGGMSKAGEIRTLPKTSLPVAVLRVAKGRIR